MCFRTRTLLVLRMTAVSILKEYYPTYRREGPLPSDLLLLTMDYLFEKKHTYSTNIADYYDIYVGEILWKKISVYKNGKPCKESYYLDGKPHGTMREWNMNGQMLIYVLYNKGVILEKRAWWNTGALYYNDKYVDGHLHGERKRFHGNGAVWACENYVNGLLHGTFSEFTNTGKLVFEEMWEYGKFVH